MRNVHEGHRDRLKTKFRNHGLDSFTDYEAFELLLFYAIPRRDTNELAHALLDRFGSFRAVLEADAEDLAAVPGIGESAAGLIALVAAMNRRYLRSERGEGRQLLSSEAAGEFLRPLFAYRAEETVFLLCLDSASRVQHCREMSTGTINRVELGVRDVVDQALRDRAARVILAHNHLSGTALPSQSDIAATTRLYQALRLIGVELADHIIVCDNDFVSMRDSGLFNRL